MPRKKKSAVNPSATITQSQPTPTVVPRYLGTPADGRTDLADFQRVCRYLGVSRSTLLRNIYSHKISAIKIGGGWKFRWEDVERFVEKRTLKAA